MNESNASAYADHPESFNCWAVVELMGHQKTAGLVSEHSLAGKAMIRVDIPDAKGELRITRFYSPEAIYSITPVDRQIAIGYATHYCVLPVQIYDLRKLVEDKRVGEGDAEPDFDED